MHVYSSYAVLDRYVLQLSVHLAILIKQDLDRTFQICDLYRLSYGIALLTENAFISNMIILSHLFVSILQPLIYCFLSDI